MADVLRGRWTAEVDGEFTVMLFGARIGVPWRSWRAVPLLATMPKMLADLEKDPDKGLLGWQQHGVGPFGVIVQYWRSFEDIERFAKDPADRHAAVWREWFRRAQHKNAAAGIWHETFLVRPGGYEAVYQNMPATFGLMGAGTPHRLGARDGAERRLGVPESATPAPV